LNLEAIFEKRKKDGVSIEGSCAKFQGDKRRQNEGTGEEGLKLEDWTKKSREEKLYPPIKAC